MAKTGLIFAFAGGLLKILSGMPGFADRFAVLWYRFASRVIGGAAGQVPIALSELLAIFLLAALLGGIVHCRRRPPAVLKGIVLVSGILFFLYEANCGVNYYRTSFSAEEGLDTSGATEEELISLCLLMRDRVNETAAASGTADPAFSSRIGQAEETSLSTGELISLGGRCRDAMKLLGTRCPSLEGEYPPPKPLLFSRVLTVQQVTGIYLPFFIEACYNREIPYYNLPFTICHELSHLRGFMREDEANFIGFLACAESGDPELMYSAYLSGFVYAGNALAKENRSAYREIYRSLCDGAKQDLTWNNTFWDAYEGAASEAHEKVNDAYLRANGQEEGTKSYGRMVDLMAGWYREGRDQAGKS